MSLMLASGFRARQASAAARISSMLRRASARSYGAPSRDPVVARIRALRSTAPVSSRTLPYDLNEDTSTNHPLSGLARTVVFELQSRSQTMMFELVWLEAV